MKVRWGNSPWIKKDKKATYRGDVKEELTEFKHLDTGKRDIFHKVNSWNLAINTVLLWEYLIGIDLNGRIFDY